MNTKSLTSLTILVFWGGSTLAIASTQRAVLRTAPRMVQRCLAAVPASSITTIPATIPTTTKDWKMYQIEIEKKRQAAQRLLKETKDATLRRERILAEIELEDYFREFNISAIDKLFARTLLNTYGPEFALKAIRESKAQRKAESERFADWKAWRQYTGDVANKSQKSGEKALADVSTEEAQKEKFIKGYKRRKASERPKSHLRDYATVLGLGAFGSYLYEKAREAEDSDEGSARE